jgi:hypothetical protein
VGAAADCELIGPGLFGQPVNSLTTIAFLVGGLLVLARRRDRVWVATSLIATGVGSFLFHGPMPAGSEWAHDVTLAWMLVVIAVDHRADRARWDLGGLATLGVLFAVAPTVADPVAVGLTVVALASVLRRERSIATVGPLALLAVAALIGRLGATGGPLCDPASLLQPHGLWHIAAAGAVTWWAMAAGVSRSPAPHPPP